MGWGRGSFHELMVLIICLQKCMHIKRTYLMDSAASMKECFVEERILCVFLYLSRCWSISQVSLTPNGRTGKDLVQNNEGGGLGQQAGEEGG